MLCLSKMLILALLCHRPCLTLASKHTLDSAMHCIMALNRGVNAHKIILRTT